MSELEKSANSDHESESASDSFAQLLEEMILQKKALDYLNKPGVLEAIDVWLDRKGRTIGVVVSVEENDQTSGRVSFRDQSGLPLGFSYDLKNEPELFPDQQPFAAGEIISLDMNGIYLKGVRKIKLTKEDTLQLIEYLRKQTKGK